MPNLRYHISLAALTIALIVLAVLCLLIGSVDISAGAVWDIICGRGAENKAWEIIVLQSRVPTIITAALAGAALAVSGLLLQTTFNNPLAGPSILGVSSGAGLGVAVVMLAFGGVIGSNSMGVSIGSYVATLLGAVAGAGAVLGVLMAMATIVKSNTMLLIVGILISYLTSSIVSLHSLGRGSSQLCGVGLRVVLGRIGGADAHIRHINDTGSCGIGADGEATERATAGHPLRTKSGR